MAVELPKEDGVFVLKHSAVGKSVALSKEDLEKFNREFEKIFGVKAESKSVAKLGDGE